MKMDTEDYIDLLSARAADARAMIMFFAVWLKKRKSRLRFKNYNGNDYFESKHLFF